MAGRAIRELVGQPPAKRRLSEDPLRGRRRPRRSFHRLPVMKTAFPALLAAAVATTSLAAQWNQMSPTTQPAARTAAGMACNPFTNTLMLFGGYGGTGTGTMFNDTWSYDGANWTQLTPPTSPTAKFYMDIVYDSSRGVFVMYGGNATYTSPGVNETWEFDGATWTQRFPATNPGNLGLHAMVFDAVRNRVVLYGGMPGGNPIVDSNRTWEYDGTNWTQRFPANNPGRLEAHSMCFHAGIGSTILFGGVDATNGVFPPDNDKTWAYDGTNWTELPIAGSRPPLRERARMAYDPLRGVCVLTGGMHYSNGQPRNDTWELRLNGTTWTWTQVPTPSVPANFYRFNSTLAFMLGDGSMVQFGGMRGSSTYYGDTWKYENPANTRTFGIGCQGSNGVPALAASDVPRLGRTITMAMQNLAPTASFALLVVGFSDLVGTLGPLPAPLAGFGMPGCSAYVANDVVLLIAAAAGTASSPLQVPNNASLVGLPLFHQGLSLDAGANAAGITASNAVATVVGY